MKTLLPLFLVAAAALADNYPRQPGVDAQHYVFRVTLSDATDEIQGEATADLLFVRNGVTQAVLDLAGPKDGKGMTVTSVTWGGEPVRYTHNADRLAFQLEPEPKAGERRQFTIQYHGAARAGLHTAKNKYGDRTFFSWNWPALARQWLPLIDHPYDKATSEFLITAPAKYQVVANGLLVEELDLGGGERMTHWRESAPIASWLNNIGVAQFAARRFDRAGGVPLETWVFPQDRDKGIVTFEEPMRQAIQYFSDYIGPYPYEKLASIEVTGLDGGMEHASAVFYGDRSLTNQPAFSLVAHEVSHQWWGDSVTEKDWDDAWLSEGFATYFAALATERYRGRDAFTEMMKRSRAAVLQMERRAPQMAVIHDNLPEIQDGRAPAGIVYQKGAWFLHMLRGLLGEENFREGLREYYRKFRDGNASTEDLRGVMERTSGRKLDWFFDQWLRRRGSPAVNIIWSYRAGDKKLALDLTQTQPGEPYRLPMEIGITLAGAAPSTKEIELTGRKQHFEIACGKDPESVDIDPGTWLLMEVKVTNSR